MQNKNSVYYDNFLINKLFIPERFYSEKYGDIEKILKKI